MQISDDQYSGGRNLKQNFNNFIYCPARHCIASYMGHGEGASLPKFGPKLHESEIEPINIDINSALDWGGKESPDFPLGTFLGPNL